MITKNKLCFEQENVKKENKAVEGRREQKYVVVIFFALMAGIDIVLAGKCVRTSRETVRDNVHISRFNSDQSMKVKHLYLYLYFITFAQNVEKKEKN